MTSPRRSLTNPYILLLLAHILHELAAYSFDVFPDPVQNPAGLSEFSVTEEGLVDVLCVGDAGTAIACSCTVTGSNPPVAPFRMDKRFGDRHPRVYYTGNGVVNTLTRYVVTVTCTDDAKPSDPAGTDVTSVTVNVIKNTPPVFDNFPSVITAEVSARQTTPGTSVTTVTATDREKNAIMYSMTQNPDNGFFAINAGTGEITVAKTLRSSDVDVHRLTVRACDASRCGEDLQVIVPLKDINTAPTFSNLPSTVNVPESASGGTVLTTLKFSDLEGDAVDTTCSAQPANEAYKFVYDVNTHQIKLNRLVTSQTLLDYDRGTNKYIVTCVATDGYLSTKSELTVNVQNVNEPPVFPDPMYYCTLTESNAGVSQCDLGLDAYDPDPNDKVTYTILPGRHSNRFSYLASTNRLTFAVDYDVDGGAMNRSTVLTVEARDSLGRTSTSLISVTVNDANDNTCRFDNSVQSTTVSQGRTPGVIGTLHATDKDITSPNNNVRYEMAGGDSSYMYLMGDGTIHYRQQIPESEHGRTFFLQVRCVDGGSPARSATATFALTYVTTTTSTTTTTTTTTTTPTPTTTTTTAAPESQDIWDDEGFVAMFSMLMLLLGLLLAALLTYLCCCGGLGGGLCPGPYSGKGFQNGRGCGGCGEDAGCDDCCYPRPRKPRIEPRDEFYLSEEPFRVSSSYKDFAWSNNDVIQDGTFGGIRSSSAGGTGMKALPAPPGFY